MIYDFYKVNHRYGDYYLLVHEGTNTWLEFDSNFTRGTGSDNWNQQGHILKVIKKLGTLKLTLEKPLEHLQKQY